MSKQKELVKNTIILFIGKIATQLLVFFLLPLYTKYLNPADYGYIDLVLTYIQLLIPIVILELDMGVFRYLIDNRSNINMQKKTISSTLYLIIYITFLFAIISLILTAFINIKYIFLIILDIIVTIFSNYFLQISRGLGKNVNYSIGCFISGFITVLSNIIQIIILKKGAQSILLSAILGNSLCTIYLFISLKIYKYISRKSVDKKTNKEIIKYSIPLIPNFLSWWIVGVSDRTLITTFLDVSANGIYATATKFPSIIYSLFSIFSLSWTESASLHINEKDKNEFFSSIANSVVKIFSCLSMCLIAVMPFIFNIFIKNQYTDSYFQIPILTLGSFFNCLVLIYSAIYVAKKMTKQVAMTSIFAAIINIVINFLFIKIIGLYAASISTTVAYLTMTIYRHFDSKKYVIIKYETKNIIGCCLGFLLVFVSYYINNIYLNIITLFLTILFSFIVNKQNIHNFKIMILNKIK